MVFEGVVSVACFIAVRNKNRGMSPNFSNQSRTISVFYEIVININHKLHFPQQNFSFIASWSQTQFVRESQDVEVRQHTVVLGTCKQVGSYSWKHHLLSSIQLRYLSMPVGNNLVVFCSRTNDERACIISVLLIVLPNSTWKDRYETEYRVVTSDSLWCWISYTDLNDEYNNKCYFGLIIFVQVMFFFLNIKVRSMFGLLKIIVVSI